MIRTPLTPGSKFKLIACEANKGKGLYAESEGFIAYPDSLCHVNPAPYLDTVRLLITKSGKKGKLRLQPQHIYVSTFVDDEMLKDAMSYQSVFGSGIILSVEKEPINLAEVNPFMFLAWSFVYNDYLNLLINYTGVKSGDIIPKDQNKLKELQNLQQHYDDNSEVVLEKVGHPAFRAGIIDNIRTVERRVFKALLPTKISRSSDIASATALLQTYERCGTGQKYKDRLIAFIEDRKV